jgi:hypothetical protein
MPAVRGVTFTVQVGAAFATPEYEAGIGAVKSGWSTRHERRGAWCCGTRLAEGGEEVAGVVDALACLRGGDCELFGPVALCGRLDFVPCEGGSDMGAGDAAE